MGKSKRKAEKSEEEIRRKIRKLQEELATKVVNYGASTSRENINVYPPDTPQDEISYYEPFSQYDETPRYFTTPSPEHAPSPPPQRDPSPPPQRDPSPPSQRDPSPAPQPETSPPSQPVLPEQQQADPSVLPNPTSDDKQTTNATEEVELGEDILELLGDAPKPDSSLGPAIHRDIANRWQNILLKGLPKDVKEKLLKEYLVPANCDLLLPPSLNLEVKAAISEPLVKRDFSLLNRQNQIGIALSALAQVTEMVISNETSKPKLLKPLSDACRLLCDSHYLETKTRRHFVITSINAKMKNTLSESTRDKFLFGENVADKLKAAKNIQQSGDALKNAPTAKPRVQRPSVSATSSNRGRLNFVPQHRKTDNKPNEVRRPNNPPQRPHNNSAGRSNDRSATTRPQTFHRR